MGLMTNAGFRRLTNLSPAVVVSDDPAPESNRDISINPTGGRTTTLATGQAALSNLGVTTWTGQENVALVQSSLSEIRRVGLQLDADTLSVDALDDALVVDGFDVLQVQPGLRLVNTTMPKFRFAT
jgi:hypothetical protein